MKDVDKTLHIALCEFVTTSISSIVSIKHWLMQIVPFTIILVGFLLFFWFMSVLQIKMIINITVNGSYNWTVLTLHLISEWLWLFTAHLSGAPEDLQQNKKLHFRHINHNKCQIWNTRGDICTLWQWLNYALTHSEKQSCFVAVN